MKSQFDVGLICVDYLQLVSTGRSQTEPPPGDRRWACDEGHGARAGHPGGHQSQLSRNVERREDKRPILSDLAESGSIEAEADLVCLLFRESYYQRKKQAEEAKRESDLAARPHAESPEATGVDIAELIVAKHRNGPVGAVKLAFNLGSRIFDNIDNFRTAQEIT